MDEMKKIEARGDEEKGEKEERREAMETMKKNATDPDSWVKWAHDCKGQSRYHFMKYRHWAKIVSSVDTTKANGWAFQGEWLPTDREDVIRDGAIVVEFCTDSYRAYRVSAAGKELIARAYYKNLVDFVRKVAEAVGC